MAKNPKKLLKSSWIRRCSVLMGCALILICSLVPSANAFLIVEDSTKLQPILSGSVSVEFYPVSDDAVDFAIRTYPFGDRVPWIVNTGQDYYGENAEDFVLSRSNDPEWSIETVTRIRRYKVALTLTNSSYSFDKIRYNLATYETASGFRNDAYYRGMTYHFDPYYFSSFDGTLFLNLFDFRFLQKRNVQTTVTFSYYDENSNQVVTKTLTDIVKGVGNSNIEVFYPLENFVDGTSDQDILHYVDEGQPVFINSIECIVTPEVYTDQISGVTFELLSEQWASGKPRYIRNDSSSDFLNYVNNAIQRGSGGPPIDFPDIQADVVARWLAGVVGGFFDVEFIPGFSFGNIFSVLITIFIVIIVLKVFGGG